MSPHSGTSTGWNLPSIIRSRSTWIVGTHVGIDVWFENDAPSTSRQSASATVWLATGMPERPSTPQPSGWSSGIVPLALNVEMTGASRCSANARTASRWARAPLPMTIAGLAAAPSSSTARCSSASGGAIVVAATRPAAGGRPASATPGQLLHLVGQHEVGDVALHDGVLHRQRGQLGRVRRATGRSGSTRRPAGRRGRAGAPGTCRAR